MEKAELGRTGIVVSRIGMGTAPIQGVEWGDADDANALRGLLRGFELGVRLVDTADSYGQGHSEELVGRAIRDYFGTDRKDLVVSTKVGLWKHGTERVRYDRPGIEAALDASLRRLQVDRVDLYLCHLWFPERIEMFLETFRALQAKGKIRAFGISPDDLSYIQQANADNDLGVVEVDYSLLNRRPESAILPYCAAHNIGVITRSPLARGMLTNTVRSASDLAHWDATIARGDVRSLEWFIEQPERTRDDLRKVRCLEQLVNAERQLPQIALRFLLDQPAVSAVIPGFRGPSEVEPNIRAAALPHLTPFECESIDKCCPPGTGHVA